MKLKSQSPNSKFQANLKFQRPKQSAFYGVALRFGYWDLFGNWDLELLSLLTAPPARSKVEKRKVLTRSSRTKMEDQDFIITPEDAQMARP